MVSVRLKSEFLTMEKRFSWREGRQTRITEEIYEEKGQQMKANFERRGREKMMILQQFLLMILAEFLSMKMGIEKKILDRGMRPRKSLQEPTIFSDKICSLEAQKVLATFWYNKYYRWLTTSTTEFSSLNWVKLNKNLHNYSSKSVITLSLQLQRILPCMSHSKP